MRKSIFGMLVAVPVLMSSCLNGSNEQHNTTLTYLNKVNMAGVVYADETMDSMCVYSTDSWQATTQAPEWLTFDDNQKVYNFKIVNTDGMTLVAKRLDLHMTPNTTGHAREGRIKVHTDYLPADMPMGISYTQRPVFRYARPIPTLISKDSFALHIVDSAFVQKDSIKFQLLNNWTMKVDEDSAAIDWLTIDKTSGEAGLNVVNINITQKNTTGADRFAQIILQSGGITNKVRLYQLKEKK